VRRTLATIGLLGIVATACVSEQPAAEGAPLSWQSADYVASLPDDPIEAFVTHVRYAVFQVHGAGSFVDRYPDDEVAYLGVLWCRASPRTFVVRDELARRGENSNPNDVLFFPPTPIFELVTQVARIQEAALCPAVDRLGLEVRTASE
jgi:hypothetical protein